MKGSREVHEERRRRMSTNEGWREKKNKEQRGRRGGRERKEASLQDSSCEVECVVGVGSTSSSTSSGFKL